MSADILKEPGTPGRLNVGNFGSKGGLQRIAPLKSGRPSSQSPKKNAQDSVQVSSRRSSAKST